MLLHKRLELKKKKEEVQKREAREAFNNFFKIWEYKNLIFFNTHIHIHTHLLQTSLHPQELVSKLNKRQEKKKKSPTWGLFISWIQVNIAIVKRVFL